MLAFPYGFEWTTAGAGDLEAIFVRDSWTSGDVFEGVFDRTG